MRVARRIKQRMYYALLIGKEPIYERDDQGNIIYRIQAGERIPVETGEFKDKYSNPIMFFNSISGQLTLMTIFTGISHTAYAQRQNPLNQEITFSTGYLDPFDKEFSGAPCAPSKPAHSIVGTSPPIFPVVSKSMNSNAFWY